MKTCTRCGELKDDADFNRAQKNRDGLHSYCRECQKAHYHDNIVRHMANVRRTSRARIARMRAIVFEAMSGGCVDCGIRDIRVLEFDHVRGTKVGGIGQIIRFGRSVETLRTEIAKCDIRCKNCHAIQTFTRMGGSWHDAYLR